MSEEERTDFEIEVTSCGFGQVKLNGAVLPRTTGVNVESDCSAPARVTVRFIADTVKYTITDR